MIVKTSVQVASSRLIRNAAIAFVLIGCISILAAGVWKLAHQNTNRDAFVFYTVKKSTLPIVVTERGNLDSQVETTITCNVENVAVDRSGNAGTQIIFIVPNGSAVNKGDLLVEFDSATIRDRLDTQTLAFQKASSVKIQADAKYKNQLIQNETAESEAALAVDLAQIEHEMYVDPQDGTLQLAVEQIERQMDDAKNSTLEARAALELAKVDRAGIKRLFELGYRGKSDLEQSHLKYLQAEDRLASGVNQMRTLQANRRKLTRFEKQMEEMRLKGAVDTAIRGLAQVGNDNQSLARQALAALEEAVNGEQKEEERLERIKLQLENCKIVAPHSGMVVYYRERRRNVEIAEGVTVRERQKILTLPDLSRMEVKTQVHEAVLDQVRPGLRATVRVDAFPDRIYGAFVESVAVVPSDQGWMSQGGAKTYETVVRMIDEVEGLKPGMTAVVNMHVDEIEDALAVPVQAVVQASGETWCYTQAAQGVERREIKIGRSNDKFVQIREGLAVGSRVVLNPTDILERERQETNEISPETGAPAIPDSVDFSAAETPQAGDESGSQNEFRADQQRGGGNSRARGPRGGGRSREGGAASGREGRRQAGRTTAPPSGRPAAAVQP